MLKSLPRLAMNAPAHVPIPPRGVDYRGKVVLAPMVRSGELPTRLLALKYGADLVWGPETVDRALAGACRRVNPRNGTIEFTRIPSNGGRSNNTTDDPAKAPKESVIYRIDPQQEKGKLVFQLGTASLEYAIPAAKLVAGDVAGIDVNAGCPKPFSTHGGMGAALLHTPDRLVSILEGLINEVGNPFQIGISVKIRILKTPDQTAELVKRLCATGITGLTVHCRTTPMRPRERAIRDQLKIIASTCRNAGVACVMNGDVTSRDEALALMKEYGVDGAMLATAAEANPSCFRSLEQGGLVPWRELAHEFLQASMQSENKFANARFMLNMYVPGKNKEFKAASTAKSYADYCHVLKFDDLLPVAVRTDEILGLTDKSIHYSPTSLLTDPAVPSSQNNKAVIVQNAMNSESARAAGGSVTRSVSSTATQPKGGGPIRTTPIPIPAAASGKPEDSNDVAFSVQTQTPAPAQTGLTV